MDDIIDTFVAFTGATPDVARRYLEMTDNNSEQAIQLYFDSPDLASGLGQSTQPSAPSIPSSTRPQPRAASAGREDSKGVVHLDDDDEDMIDLDDGGQATSAAAIGRAADYEDDEAIARRMQEEFYGGGDASGGLGADGVRAPIGRTTETLVGGHGGGGWGADDMQAAVEQQMRNRLARVPGRPGVFNQRPVPSIWDESADATTRRQGLAEATGGGSETSSKAALLAELFRPPFELMNQMAWDDARDKGKEDAKWILVNVQDPSIFDCQQLNRDIWKHDGIKEVVKENFIFMQYSKDDPRGSQYIQYYFLSKDSDAAYPHIAIVDPRTGEQMKVWSGPPVPNAGDFLMQLVEFLDRYSLDVTKKNPVAKRKPEKPKSIDIDRLTEEEMLDLALQNSLANTASAGPKEHDPDDLTKSFGDASKGKGKEVDNGTEEETAGPSNGHPEEETSEPSTYSRISSNNPHVEPAPGPDVTRVQFRHSTGRIVRRFRVDDPVLRIFEWLKADPLEGKEGVPFDLTGMGKDLGDYLEETIEDAGLKNGTVMVEFLED
ncbi:UBX domain-containing protein [Lachnellula hyalina]|uniref:UBX domain-containing protein n=1 Tax=Lachnellula hyalina TaxID=1316788 RepID=A0A8H8R8Q7_9HELO|nr:UBX domain-containing protein [Lachnellula hyalina]TVY30415.1 UBX domain-containing protein [Lachnellula hyalina]